jgi:hypothetical protein
MLFQQLKNVGKWAFKQLEKSGQAIADAEDRMVESMFIKKDKDESKEK